MGKRFAILIGVTAVGVMALGAQTAAAAAVQQLKCGDTITTDTTLHKDLVNCPTSGIVIGADNVTLDLNGHTIDGDGTLHPAGGGFRQDVGVNVLVHDGITVKNGSIRQFGEGLDAFGGRQIRLLDLATSRNQRIGITLAADDRILVENCSVNRMTEGAGLLVTSASGPGIGDRSGPSHHVRIVDSSFRNNAGGGISSGGTTNSVIEGNLLSHNGDTGIAWGGDRSQLSGNRIIGGGRGIDLSGHRNVIARNRVSGGREGIRIDRGGGNLLAGNVVAGAATSIWIKGERGQHEDRVPGAVHTVIRGNRLLRANRDGVFVESTAKDTLLRHNSARHSQGDGFDVNDRSTKLSRNHAVRNHDLGIGAVRGVTDGGGNVARHNGDPRQCTHIVCSR